MNESPQSKLFPDWMQGTLADVGVTSTRIGSVIAWLCQSCLWWIHYDLPTPRNGIGSKGLPINCDI